MKVSKELALLRNLLASPNVASPNGGNTASKYIQLESTGKNGGPMWLILTQGDGVIYLTPEKGGKTKVSSEAGTTTVDGTPDEVKAIFEA